MRTGACPCLKTFPQARGVGTGSWQEIQEGKVKVKGRGEVIFCPPGGLDARSELGIPV
jgi:hypothetical protein